MALQEFNANLTEDTILKSVQLTHNTFLFCSHNFGRMTYKKCYKEEFMHVDSISVTQHCGLNTEDSNNNVFILVGLSSLEGNIWDGAIRLISDSLSYDDEEGLIYLFYHRCIKIVNTNYFSRIHTSTKSASFCSAFCQLQCRSDQSSIRRKR